MAAFFDLQSLQTDRGADRGDSHGEVLEQFVLHARAHADGAHGCERTGGRLRNRGDLTGHGHIAQSPQLLSLRFADAPDHLKLEIMEVGKHGLRKELARIEVLVGHDVTDEHDALLASRADEVKLFQINPVRGDHDVLGAVRIQEVHVHR